VKQLLVPFVLIYPRALIGVPLKLVYRFFHWCGTVRALAFDYDEWNAVHEQHEVRNNVPLDLASRFVESELANDTKGIVDRVVPVDEVHGT
jgi:hypothetical protein